MAQKKWQTHNPSGSKRVIVTKEIPGSLWLERLIRADCKVEVCTSTDVLSVDEIKTAIGTQCDAVLGQLTEDWGDELFGALKTAGGTAYSNVAVGFNNVDIDAATNHGIPVAFSRITRTAPTISSMVSPFILTAVIKEPIWASVALPPMISFITEIISVSVRS